MADHANKSASGQATVSWFWHVAECAGHNTKLFLVRNGSERCDRQLVRHAVFGGLATLAPNDQIERRWNSQLKTKRS
jgi:hypothetical protein